MLHNFNSELQYMTTDQIYSLLCNLYHLKYNSAFTSQSNPWNSWKPPLGYPAPFVSPSWWVVTFLNRNPNPASSQLMYPLLYLFLQLCFADFRARFADFCRPVTENLHFFFYLAQLIDDWYWIVMLSLKNLWKQENDWGEESWKQQTEKLMLWPTNRYIYQH